MWNSLFQCGCAYKHMCACVYTFATLCLKRCDFNGSGFNILRDFSNEALLFFLDEFSTQVNELISSLLVNEATVFYKKNPGHHWEFLHKTTIKQFRKKKYPNVIPIPSSIPIYPMTEKLFAYTALFSGGLGQEAMESRQQTTQT